MVTSLNKIINNYNKQINKFMKLFFFAYDIINGTITRSDHEVSNNWVTDELEEMWEKVAVAEFEMLFWHLCGGTEETTEIL
jgi:hypothetical protein